MTRSAFAAAVLAVLRALQPGQVVTYGEVAAEAGHPGAARAVGTLLRALPDVPWWRVVAADGRVFPGAAAEAARRLAAEGVVVHDGRVDSARGAASHPEAGSRNNSYARRTSRRRYQA